jgi:hypothetical protein
MFSSTALTLIIVPVFYVALDNAAEATRRRVRGWLRRGPLAEPASGQRA